MIAGLQRPSAGEAFYRGRLLCGPEGVRHRAAAGLDIQMVFQNPYASLNPRHPVRRQLTEPALAARLCNSDEAARRAEQLIEAVGLARSDLDKYPHEFSGGQRQRISIARALSVRPSVLICDEPTSALDVSVQASVLNLLKDLNRELALTVLFISHDLPVCRHMCDDIAVMHRGRLCESGDAVSVLDAPQHDYTKSLVAAIPPFAPAFENSLEAGAGGETSAG